MRVTRRLGGYIALCVLVARPAPANAQNCADLFDIDQVLDLHFTMASGDWDRVRESCPGGDCGEPPYIYWPAFIECGNSGLIFVGIRRKHGLAEPSEAIPQKVALKIDVDEFIAGQDFFGRKKLSLENAAGALVTEGLAWQVYHASGAVASRAAWVNVFVNGEHKGLYVNVEQIDKTFLSDRSIDNDGFLFKVHNQRTREAEVNPFAFNWYPFDHPIVPPEQPPPPDWREQAVQRVDIPNLLRLAVAENFVANTDGAVQEMANYWYYDWSILLHDGPVGQQPRLYFAWDLDGTMQTAQTEMPLTDSGAGHLQQGLIDELDESGVPFPAPTFHAAYLTIYRDLISGPLALAALNALVDRIEPVVSADMDADPFQQTGPAADEFQRIREFLLARSTFVLNELFGVGPGDYDGDGDVDLYDFAALGNCYTGDGPTECAAVECRDTFDQDDDCDVDRDDFEVLAPLLTAPAR